MGLSCPPPNTFGCIQPRLPNESERSDGFRQTSREPIILGQKVRVLDILSKKGVYRLVCGYRAIQYWYE
jgi:hypothetical protein